MSGLPSLPARIADRLTGLMSGRYAATAEPATTGVGSGFSGPLGAMLTAGVVEAYFGLINGPTTRLEEMRFMDYLETEMPDVGKGLDAFCTMACTGTLEGASRGTFCIRMPEGAPAALLEWMKLAERVIARESYSLIRGMAKYGSYPASIRIGELMPNKLGVMDLNHMPPGTMFRDPLGGEKGYWVQRVGSSEKKLPRWLIPHFAIWTNIVSAEKVLLYGTPLMKPAGRLGIQLLSCTDAMVIHRLTRAAMRYAFQIDVSDIIGDETKVLERLKMYEQSFSRQRQVNANGKFDGYQRAPVPDGDFYIPASKNGSFAVEAISGDGNIANIKDLELLVRFWLAALGVPPAYLGHGQDGGGRSSLSQVDIHFARSSRYLQMFASAAFEHIAAVHMILGGWDPEQYPFEIVPPAIGARDELLRAQIKLLQSQAVANLVKAGFDPTVNPKWVLQTLLTMGEETASLTPEEIGRIFSAIPDIAGAGDAPKRPDRASGSREDALIRAMRQGAPEYVKNLRLILALDNMSAPDVRIQDRPSVRNLRDGILLAA